VPSSSICGRETVDTLYDVSCVFMSYLSLLLPLLLLLLLLRRPTLPSRVNSVPFAAPVLSG
jgi:hypothetical protein